MCFILYSYLSYKLIFYHTVPLHYRYKYLSLHCVQYNVYFTFLFSLEKMIFLWQNGSLAWFYTSIIHFYFSLEKMIFLWQNGSLAWFSLNPLSLLVSISHMAPMVLNLKVHIILHHFLMSFKLFLRLKFTH